MDPAGRQPYSAFLNMTESWRTQRTSSRPEGLASWEVNSEAAAVGGAKATPERLCAI